MTATYGEALALADVSIPEHLEAEAEVPVLTGPQCQGDLMIVPLDQAYDAGQPVPDWPLGDVVPAAGIQVVHGEATGNTHWLHQGIGSSRVRFYRADDGGLVTGVVTVPAGETSLLIHTDEHGANATGAGRYEIRRKQEQADQVRYVED
jgi:hypothetical protein